MARLLRSRDLTPILEASANWRQRCLIEDAAIFSDGDLWTLTLVDEVQHAFVDHPDFGMDGFITKLKGQMQSASGSAQQLAAEMLWALLLFPSNMKAATKRQQVREMWALSGQALDAQHPALHDCVLVGIGSGGPAFNTFRPLELTYLIGLTRDLKRRQSADRASILGDYDAFMAWIANAPQAGQRQFRHMLRYFAFPDRVERMSSNGNRQRVLAAFGGPSATTTSAWSDRDFDDALFALRGKLQESHPGEVLDFYEEPLVGRWSRDSTVKTPTGDVIVTVPADEDEAEEAEVPPPAEKQADQRQSIRIQACLAEIGAIMGFKIWVPASDRNRVGELVSQNARSELLTILPLNYDNATLGTIEQIDVLWLKGRSIARAFEVEHTTAVYSGLLRMADLLALQPNMDIRLHIVAPAERREKVFREMLRPVFSLLDRGPLSQSCTFIAYDSVDAIRSISHLAHTSHSIIAEYEEKADISSSV